MIAWLITSRIGRALALTGAILLALVTFGASQRRKGADGEADRQERIDHETATEIRDDVRRARADGVSDYEIEYRD